MYMDSGTSVLDGMYHFRTKAAENSCERCRLLLPHNASYSDADKKGQYGDEE